MKCIIPGVMSCLLLLISASFVSKDDWQILLDKNLSRWEIYQSYRHALNYNGDVPKNEKGEIIPPIGYNKNESNVFSTYEENGKPVLRVSGEIYGCLYTKEEYENFHLRLKVKWGSIKWDPRKQKLKDSGICYFSTGKCGVDFWRAWMLSQEFQIMEGHMGDYWNISNSAIDVRAYLPEGSMNAVADNHQPFLSMGTGSALEGFCLRTVDNASPEGEWTDIDLICFKGNSLHIVNGKVVMVLANSRYHENGKDFPMSRGKIQIQSEGAEVFYKDIQIKNLDSLPEEYAVYYK